MPTLRVAWVCGSRSRLIFFSLLSDKKPVKESEESSSSVAEQEKPILSDQDIKNLTITAQDLEKVCVSLC